MKLQSNIKPSSNLVVEEYEDNSCKISFYENIKELEEKVFEYDYYSLTRHYRNKLEQDIQNNYNIWLAQAKLEEDNKEDIDVHQLRADLDYVMIMNNSVSTMSLESDPEILDKCYKYYPIRWNKDQLLNLVNLGEITQEDFNKIIKE